MPLAYSQFVLSFSYMIFTTQTFHAVNGTSRKAFWYSECNLMLGTVQAFIKCMSRIRFSETEHWLFL
jgi:hypothetical protein